MVDLVKLDNTINELEESSRRLLKLNEMLDDINRLSIESKDSQIALQEIVTKINGMLKESQTSLEGGKKANKILEELCDSSKAADAKFMSEINTLLLDIKNENHKLYRNFENTIMSKFEQFKVDVILENHKELESRLSNFDKTLNNQKFIIAVMVAISMLASVVSIGLQLL